MSWTRLDRRPRTTGRTALPPKGGRRAVRSSSVRGLMSNGTTTRRCLSAQIRPARCSRRPCRGRTPHLRVADHPRLVPVGVVLCRGVRDQWQVDAHTVGRAQSTSPSHSRCSKAPASQSLTQVTTPPVLQASAHGKGQTSANGSPGRCIRADARTDSASVRLSRESA